MKNSNLEQVIDGFCKVLDIEYQVDFVKKYADIGDSNVYGGKHCGSDAEHEGSRFIADKLEEIGVQNVELIPCNTARYQFNDATVKIIGEERIIKPYGYVSPGTDQNGICAELIDMGKSTSDEYKGIDVSGKIVLFAAMGTLEGGNLAGQMEEAINHGAAAVIIYAVEDVLNEDTIRVQPPNIISPVPIVGVCRKDAEYLKQAAVQDGCLMELVVDADYNPNGGTTYNVVGEIPGKLSSEKIIYTAHLDHYFKCLQDNISSCSTLLGIAKAILDSGYQPNRTIVFAFHGSHETGGQDTRYPYIYGSYKLVHEGKPQWSGEAIININFEYTALSQNKMQMLAYMGTNKTVQKYWEYSPDLVGGFKEKVKDAPQTEYYMMSWSDNISYLTAGIPVVTNDPITDQLYNGEGPYVGRDHSNFDNWDVFDTKALEDTGRMYGGLGLFVDSLPYMILDFEEQTERVLREIDCDFLKSLEMDADDYITKVNRLSQAAKKFNEYVDKKNSEYIKALNSGMTDIEKKKWFDDSKSINEKALMAFKEITDNLDKINSSDFLELATVKYSNNVKCLKAAAEYITSGETEKALYECLAAVDLSLSSYYFSRETVFHMRKQICDPKYEDRRTWAAGREMNISDNYDMMEAFREESAEEKNSFEKTLKCIEEAIKREISYIPLSMRQEAEVLCRAAEIVEKITEYK